MTHLGHRDIKDPLSVYVTQISPEGVILHLPTSSIGEGETKQPTQTTNNINVDNNSKEAANPAPVKYVPPHLRNTPDVAQQAPQSVHAESLRDASAVMEPSRSSWGRHAPLQDHSALSGGRSWGRRSFGNSAENLDRLEDQLFGSAKEAGSAMQTYDVHVKTSGTDIPEPIHEFTADVVNQLVLDNIIRAKYIKPTPVQQYSIPIVSAGRDLMSCAQTGSGKTAAFLVPIISSLLSEPEGQGNNSRSTPSALVLSPIRELSIQIFEEARKFTFKTGIRAVVAYGGANIRNQISELRRGCQLLIATPGRLVDLMERGYVSLSQVRYLCLDEADRMLDMGFEPQIRRIVQQADMPVQGRRTLMFSATFPNQIKRLASDFMQDHVFLAVGITGSTTKNITQKFELVEDRNAKASLLLDLLVGVPGLTIIFVETKRMADELTYFLESEGFSATNIHGDRDQQEREDAIRTFKSGQTPYLVATDVASRGLDINNVTHVINYNLPKDIDSYVHRIGRTARAGATGTATSFVSANDATIAHSLLELLAESQQEIPPWLKGIASRGRGSGMTRSGRWGARDSRQTRSNNNWSSNPPSCPGPAPSSSNKYWE